MADLQQQLIWLGAGSAAEPALDFANFSKVTLIDARAEATQALTRQYSQANNVQVITQAVAASSGAASLQHYNLAAFAALSPATGLTQLFPGLKASQSENLTTKSINELVSELALTGNQHTLVLDIPDQALSLLHALQSQQQLSLFNTIYLQYSNDELYAGMAPFSQVSAFLKQHYFALKQTDNTDPDLPVYCFTLDAAAKEVALLKQQVKTLTEQLGAGEAQISRLQRQAATEKQQVVSEKETLRQQFTAAKVAAEKTQAELHGRIAGMDAELKQALEQRKNAEQQTSSVNDKITHQAQQLAELTRQAEQLQQRAAEQQQLHTQQLNKLQAEFDQVAKHAATRLDKINQLEQSKRQLHDVNEQLVKRQQALEHEMLKAQAQIDIIKDLLLKQ